MDESIVEKREYGFLWKIIGAYLAVVVLNVLIKQFLPENALLLSSVGTGALGVLLTVLYSISLKPKLNQFLLLVFCIAVTFGAVVFMTFDLPYKKILAGVSVPFFLTLCGMWIYTKYAKEEIK